MTAQIPDTLLLQDQKLSIVGVNGKGLFDPYEIRLRAVPRASNCWRGYVCEYKLHDNKLFLNKLQINLDIDNWDDKTHAAAPEEIPPLNGVKPAFATDNYGFARTYHDLNLPVDFTGGILAAGDFIRGLYVHMGFHPAWKYRNVFELLISHGDVSETRDVSQRMEEIRSEMLKSPLEPGLDATKEQVEEWVASTFKLNYNL